MICEWIYFGSTIHEKKRFLSPALSVKEYFFCTWLWKTHYIYECEDNILLRFLHAYMFPVYIFAEGPGGLMS